MGSPKELGGEYAKSAVGYTPQCVLNSVNLPYGYNHAAVLFKGIAHHLPIANTPLYESSDNDIPEGYDEVYKGKSEATPKEIRGFNQHYGSGYFPLGPGARNCQDYAIKLVDFLVNERPCHMV